MITWFTCLRDYESVGMTTCTKTWLLVCDDNLYDYAMYETHKRWSKFNLMNFDH